jgi:hypothetical protein
LVINTRPDGIQPKMLDPDLESMNPVRNYGNVKVQNEFVALPVVRGVAAAHAHPVARLVPVHQQQHVGITVLCNTREAISTPLPANMYRTK